MAKSRNREGGGGGGGIDHLKKQFQALEQDWNSYKKSIPHRRRAPSVLGTLKAEYLTETLISALLENSPKKLISSLRRQCNSPLFDQRGEVVGKNLLEDLEMAMDDNDGESSSKCSVCSSVLIQEASSSCSCCSKESHPSSSLYHSSSSSVESSDRGVDEKKATINQEKGMMRMIWVFVGFLMVALGIMVSFGVADEYREHVTPT